MEAGLGEVCVDCLTSIAFHFDSWHNLRDGGVKLKSGWEIGRLGDWEVGRLGGWEVGSLGGW